MAKQSTPDDRSPSRQAFTFYAANGRVYANNVDQKLVDLGTLTGKDGRYGYVLDGNKQAGEGLASPEAALRHIADNIRFLFLDGQFTALKDLRGTDEVNLDGAAQVEVVI